jgi:hypothetical protein
MSKLDSRRQHRIPFGSILKLRWQGKYGESHFARGKILNRSESGVCFELSEPIQQSAYVTLNAPELSLADWAVGGLVRYCSSKGAKYIIGLEFSVTAKLTPAHQ